MRRLTETNERMKRRKMGANRPDIDAIKARVDAATPGPWGHWHKDMEFETGQVGFGLFDSIVHSEKQRNICAVHNRSDGAFIAHARIDIDALLAYVAELEARVLKEIEGRLEDLGEVAQQLQQLDAIYKACAAERDAALDEVRRLKATAGIKPTDADLSEHEPLRA